MPGAFPVSASVRGVAAAGPACAERRGGALHFTQTKMRAARKITFEQATPAMTMFFFMRKV
jgi:hypothetical protein